jgi:ubiquinone/menaquinone biosynthesis C-methylase UbiE
MNTSPHLPDYYRERYVSWYSWFSYVYDLFAKLLLFVLNGGFGGEGRLRQLVIDWLDPAPDDKVLDICSGTGTLAIMMGCMLRGSGEVVGIEISNHQLRMARRKRIPANVSFIHADAQHIGYPDSYFDKAVIFGALHEIPREVRANILAQAFRVVKPGGRIVFLEHNRPESRWRARLYALLEWPSPEYSTYIDLLRNGLTIEVATAGFTVLKKQAISLDYFQIVLAEKQC